MAITLTQTDTVPSDTGLPRSLTLLAVDGSTTTRRATSGGTAGSSEVTDSIGGSEVGSLASAAFLSAPGEPGSTSWEAGTWTFRFEITTANMFLTWDRIACAAVRNGATSGQVFTTDTAVGIAIDTTGVKSKSETGSAVSADATDQIEALYGISNGSSMAQSYGYTPSQDIDTPVTQAVPGIVKPRTLFPQYAPVRAATI